MATDFEKNGQVSKDRLTQHRLAQDKEKSRKDRLLGKTVKEKVDKKELFTLIKSALPRLDESEISETEKMISGFSLEEIKLIFQPGTYITNQGRRIQTAYIRTAPEVYKALSEEKQEDFCRWISLARKVSGLSFSCLEGFLNSSVQIITRKGLPVLENWTEHGISLTRKSNTFAIAYFNHTAGLITSQVISINFNPESLSYSLNTFQEQDSSDLYTSSYEFIPARTRPEIGSGVSVDPPFCSTQPYEPYPLYPLISSQPPDFEKSKELVSIGENLVGSNQKLAEVYFEQAPYIRALLSSDENFRLFCTIMESLVSRDWKTALELLNRAKETLSGIPSQKQKTFLLLLNEFLEHESQFILTFFVNAPVARTKLEDREFETWISITRKISKISQDAGLIFLKKSPPLLLLLQISELEKWGEEAINKLSSVDSEKKAFEKFLDSSFTGLEKHFKFLSAEERAYLQDTGIELAKIEPVCLENYFEYSPAALRLFSEKQFVKWVEIGIKILKENSNFGSAYFKTSILSFKKIPPSFQDETFEIANSLLEKDWLLAGKFFENLPEVIEKIGENGLRKWADTGIKVHTTDRKLAADFFTYSPEVLKELDVSDLEEWALNGLKVFKTNTFLGRPYFSLKSKSSRDFIEELAGGAVLSKVEKILKYYAIGLSGTNFKIRSKKELPGFGEIKGIEEMKETNRRKGVETIEGIDRIEGVKGVKGIKEIEGVERTKRIQGIEGLNPVVSGRTIYLEPKIKKYSNFKENFKIYKLSVMHEVGHFQLSAPDGDRISISNEIALFPNKILAASIFGILEDARVDYLIMENDRGVRSDLEKIRAQMLLERKAPEEELEKLMEALLWFSTLHKPVPGSHFTEKYMIQYPILEKIPGILQEYIFRQDSSTFNVLQSTLSIYELFEDALGPLENWNYSMMQNLEYRGLDLAFFNSTASTGQISHEDIIKRFIPEKEDKTEETKNLPYKKEKDQEEKIEIKSLSLSKNWKLLGTYRYDEWDYAMEDYKAEWCTLNELEPSGEVSDYYRDAKNRYRNEILLIKNIFTRMKPETFQKLKEQTDGTEIDIDAYSEALIEKRCGLNPDEKFYIRVNKHKRDVATLFLIDISASTKKRLGKRRMLDVEKDALVIMIEALESIGDKYAIYAFSGHTKENVEYYAIKEFDEAMSSDVEQRISLLEPAANTRLGPAVRHSIKKLEQVVTETKILLLLSDGEPYDTCYGEGAYQGKLAEEDTKIAIQEGNAKGIHSFCITVDTSPGNYLDTIFSDSGYTIIDNAQILPERLPLLYKRITT